jgi:hypothetical protein
MSKRLLLTGLALGLVAAIAAGAGGYAAVRGSQSAEGPVDCGGVNRCIPVLKPATVFDALKSQGHECTQDGVTWTCRLLIGVKRFEASFSVIRGLINSYDATISAPGGVVGGERATAYLVWLASLPYGNDPVLLGQIRTWVTEQVDAGKRTEVRIGDYSYEMDTSRKDIIRFDVRGRLHR